MSVRLATARRQDCKKIAYWIDKIGHGHIQYLFDGLVANRSALQHTANVLLHDPHYSYQNVTLALISEEVVGMVFTYPAHANQITDEMRFYLSDDRIEWLDFFADNQVNDSLYINTLGVKKEYRRQGIAMHLLENTLDLAMRDGVRSLSLHVYANNKAAITLYEKFGFYQKNCIDLSLHHFAKKRGLTHTIYMKKDF